MKSDTFQGNPISKRIFRDEIRKLESTELEITLNPKVKRYSQNNKIYPKGRSTMGMPGTRAQKGKKKWKQIK